jgi:ubiquinone/menaquinone biosynthesis C-methylase UbiE
MDQNAGSDVSPRFFYDVRRELVQRDTYLHAWKRWLQWSNSHSRKTLASERMTLAKEYNDWYRTIAETESEHADEQSPWYKLVLEQLPSVEGKRILEVACGRGGFAILLASQGAHVSGADFSSTALDIARRRGRASGCADGHLDLTQADAQHLPYADESFDIVISCETIEHLPEPASALKEMSRVCRAHGLLYLTTPNYFNAMGLYYLYALLHHRKATPGADQPLDRVFLFAQVRRMLRSAGWQIIRSDGTVHQFPVMPGHDPIVMQSFESNQFLRRILSPLAFHYFLMARRSKTA